MTPAERAWATLKREYVYVRHIWPNREAEIIAVIQKAIDEARKGDTA